MASWLFAKWATRRTDLDDATARIANYVNEECGKGQTATYFRVDDLEKRLGWSRAKAYRVVHKAVEKGCFTVDNVDEKGRWHVHLCLTGENGVVSSVRQTRITGENADHSLKVLEDVEDGASAREPAAPSLTHPKGLARSPVDNRTVYKPSVENDGLARLHGITRHPDDCACRGTHWLEADDGSVTKCAGPSEPKRQASTEADLLDGLAGMAAKKGNPEAARSSFRAVPNRPPNPADDDAPF